MKITSALNFSKEIPITDTDVRHLKHNFRFMIAPSQYYFDAKGTWRRTWKALVCLSDWCKWHAQTQPASLIVKSWQTVIFLCGFIASCSFSLVACCAYLEFRKFSRSLLHHPPPTLNKDSKLVELLPNSRLAKWLASQNHVAEAAGWKTRFNLDLLNAIPTNTLLQDPLVSRVFFSLSQFGEPYL